MSDQADYRLVTVLDVSVAFAMTALVTIGVLLSGRVNVAAVAAFSFFPVLAYCVMGYRAAVPSGIGSVSGLFGIVSLWSISALPEGYDWARLAVSIFATGSGVITAGWAGFAFFARYRSMTAEARPTPRDVEAVRVTPMHAKAPVLVLETTPLGRLNRRFGNEAWFPELVPGSVLDREMLNPAGLPLKPGVQTLPTGEVVLVDRKVDDEGEVWIIAELPAGAGADTQADELATELTARTVFFASLGHDLKSPLNAVMGFAEMMDDEVLGPMPDAYRDYPGLIKEGATTLLRLVEDMLHYARSEAGTYDLDPGPVDIAASGEAVMRQSQAAAKSANVTLQIKARGEVMAYADASAVHRIWDNLVSNAIKYSNPEGLVRLSASQKRGEVVLSVIDHGAGMDADDLARIAQPFAQGRNAKGRAGTGLGLATVKNLAELQGGKVIVRTALGEGTQVSVHLPALVGQGQSQAAE